ncbi:MAG: hypothetical protein LBC85_10565 [Fibromonadaceae bacterium]|jgi:hypothetical protein|nr:hypothetical protein [Fibromonadaceae bacterium]
MKALCNFSVFAVLAVFFLYACDTGGSNNSCPNGMWLNEDGVCVGEPTDGQCQSGFVLNENGQCVSEHTPGGKNAVLATNQNAGRIQEMYNAWLSMYYVTFEEEAAQGVFNPDNAPERVHGTARIKSAYGTCVNGTCTVSEAIGYGMILTALMADWEKFDRLLAYSKAWRVSGTALMRWEMVNFRSGSGGSATDADIDIVAALFIAYQKTNNQSYKNDAIEIGASIYQHEVHETSKLILPAMKSENWGNASRPPIINIGAGNLYNVSYMSLPAIKMLAEYDKERNWGAVLEANLAYMERVQNVGAGLWPDWSDANGAATDPNNTSNSILTASDGSRVNSWESYYKEGPRIPWRIAWYYHWYGDPRAKAMLDKGMDFLRSRGIEAPNQIGEFYSHDGLKSSPHTNIMVWPSLCALGMGNSANQNWLNSCNDRILGGFNPQIRQYYPMSLQLIYAMLLNGNF